MIWIGIIAWFILIWIIDCSINPFFIWVSIAIGVFLIFCVIYSWWCDNYSKAFKRQSEATLRLEREAAIDKWEEKWGRQHPSRKNNRTHKKS